MSRGPGTTCKLRILYWDGPLPPPGDLLRTRGGSCYRVEEVRAGRAGSMTLATFFCTRLGKDAVQLGDPGVWPFEWAPRG